MRPSADARITGLAPEAQVLRPRQALTQDADWRWREGFDDPYDSVMPIVAGVRLSREQTLELAAMLTRDGSDHTTRILLTAITEGHEFVALTMGDREAILAVLDRPPEGLVDLRTALFAELNWRRGMVRGAQPSTRSPYARRTSP